MAAKTFVAYVGGTCAECRKPFPKGATLKWGKEKGARCHIDCNAPDTTPQTRDQSSRPASKIANPSPMQQAIFDRLSDVNGGNLIVEAGAGTGKTSTIVAGAEVLPADTEAWFLAFGKKNAEDLEDRLPDNVVAQTFHKTCFAAWRKQQRSWPKVEKPKVQKILHGLVETNKVTRGQAAIYGASSVKLCGLAKQAGIGVLIPDEIDNWIEIVEHFGILFEDDALNDDDARSVGIALARKLLSESNADRGTIDFDDMLYFCLMDNSPFERQDFIFIDEAQDTNGIQRALLHRMIKPGGRICAVGDKNQAIYGFRGADSSAMDLIKEEFDCDSLPLSISYRCPQAVIRAAQAYVPEIQAAPNAPEGEVVQHESWDIKEFLPTDSVICRTTAPLVKLAYRCLARGVGCQVQGRDIGRGLTSLIKKMRAKSIDELSRKLGEYRVTEVARLMAKYEEAKAQAIEDKCESIEAAIEALEEPRTIQSLISHIESLFSDDDSGNILTLATIHKAKGMEWPRVFILDRSLMPHKMARQCWQQDQERNLIYVAYTRAMESLNFIDTKSIK